MSTIVIMPGGFHPFHAGHAALYQSAVKAFPGAEVFVAATNDTSNRPFPFAIKEKLAKLAGVAPGHFVQVKSPFRAEEITAQFDPAKDRLIFVRSEKDANKPPQAGGNKKDGSPAYLQPLAGQTNIRPFKEHAYMAYLPTVEFGPGMTSATEIRTAWPTLNPKRKTALVMSLYPQTQQNPKLAKNVVKMLDTAIGSELAESNMLGTQPTFQVSSYDDFNTAFEVEMIIDNNNAGFFSYQYFPETNDVENDVDIHSDQFRGQGYGKMLLLKAIETAQEHNLPFKVDRNGVTPAQGNVYRSLLADKIIRINPDKTIIATGRSLPGSDMSENQGWAATFTSEETGQMAGTPAIGGMWAGYQARENQPIDEDYIDEKWSQKYKSSINCASPKGFSQRAHCAGRKK